MTPTRPALRYHGGKWNLAPFIISHLPPHRVYVEPFGGGASVLLRKPRSYAEVYNDLDSEIVNIFRVMRDPDLAAELERRIRLTPFAREEYKTAYRRETDPVERARLTIVKSFMGYGSDSIHRVSGFRNDTSRAGTTPAHDWMHYPDSIRAFTERLQGVVIECRDAFTLIPAFDETTTLFYVDPPYVHSTRGSNGRSRYAHEMSDADHRRLASVLNSVSGMLVLSGYRCELYDELYADWTRFERETYADGARPRTECLWLSTSATQAAVQ